MKINSMKMLAIILGVLLILSVGYIAGDKMQQQAITGMQVAYQQGYIYAVSSLFAQTNNCTPTIVTLGNFTRQLVDTACLQLAQPSE